MDPIRYRVLWGINQVREFRSLAAALYFKAGLKEPAKLQTFGYTGWRDA
jgi:hypothetical protein